jgi:hypothetical protein
MLCADWLLRLTQTYKRWGFRLCFFYLRNSKGFGWNHKRVYRIYRELELNLRIKPVSFNFGAMVLESRSWVVSGLLPSISKRPFSGIQPHKFF